MTIYILEGYNRIENVSNKEGELDEISNERKWF